MSAITDRLAERRVQLADAERAARRQRLAALQEITVDRRPNGTPPRITPGEKIPGEEPGWNF